MYCKTEGSHFLHSQHEHHRQFCCDTFSLLHLLENHTKLLALTVTCNCNVAPLAFFLPSLILTELPINVTKLKCAKWAKKVLQNICMVIIVNVQSRYSSTTHCTDC